MIDNLLHICFTGTFEKLEVAVRVRVLTSALPGARDKVLSIHTINVCSIRTWWMKAMQPHRS